MSDMLITGGRAEPTDAELVKRVTGVDLTDEDAASLCDGLRSTIDSSPEATGRDPRELLVSMLRYLSPPAERPVAGPGCAGVV